MATLHLRVSEEQLVHLRKRAEESGKTVEELASEALQKGLDDQAWQDLLAYGRERGLASGFTEDQAADIVHAWRKRQRGQ